MKRIIILAGFLLLVCAAVAMGQNGRFSGYMFGDLYYVASNHKSNLEGRNGFWFRRIYFTYDKALTGGFSMQFRLEMASPGNFTSNSKLVPFVKDAYLKWSKGRHQLILGISSTPTWEIIEKVWGYRSVEKTPLDLQKWGSSRDFGLAAKGDLNESGSFKYHVMFANGAGNKGETNKGKKFLGSIGFYPNRSFLIEVYGDYESLPADKTVSTYQFFAAFKTDKIRLGVQYAHQTRTNATVGGNDLELNQVSAFLAANLSAKTNIFARVDRLMDPNPKGAGISYLPFDSTAKALFCVAGFDLLPSNDIHFIPNVEAVFYGKNEAGVKPGSDLIPRVTFYYKF